jgi:hypothetical protein
VNKRIRTDDMVPYTIYKLVDNDVQLVEAMDNENKVEIDHKIKKN